MGESQEDTSEHVCQKCGKHIPQVPYKYEGMCFHARCLTCSTCGMKLAGRPFLTEEHKIFCGEQCQSSHRESQNGSMIAMVTTTIADTGGNTNTPQLTSNGHRQQSESFLEALRNTEQTASSLSLSQSQSPLRTPEISVTRLTDYPGHTLSPTQSPGSVRHSSLSVSESSLNSSFTSEGSFGLDGSTKPRKRILKKPHGPRKHKSNRVRWNIPEEGSDSVSMLSFESTSTNSAYVYEQARNGVNEARKNWREFEEQPQPGSTGLTPSKPSLSPLLENYENVEVGDHKFLPSSLSPPLITASQNSTSPPCSPLTQSHRHSPRGAHRTSSTPLCGGYGNTSQTKSYTTGRGADSAPSAVTPPTSVPLLQLDHSNLSDLEESTLEDRVRSNLFEIPNSRNSRAPSGPTTVTNSRPPAYSGYIPPEGMAHLFGGSDADDYDHLGPKNSPLPSGNCPQLDFFSLPSKLKTRKSRLTSPPPTTGPTLTENAAPTNYGDNDIDEALTELKDSSSRSGSSAPQSPSSEPHTAPFPLGGAVAPGRGGPSQYAGPQTHRKQQFPPRASERDRVVPPPIPPKLRKRKSASPPTILSNGLRSSLSPSSWSSSGASEEPGSGSETYPSRNFHYVPPDFATGPARVVTCHSLSQEEAHEDAMSSVSNATLVPESGETSPHVVHSAHSTAPNTPKQQAKFDQTNKLAAVGSSARMAASSRVHPEMLPTSSSQSVPQSWKESRATKLAHHPPPLLYHHKPPTSAYSHDSHFPQIEETHNPQRQAIINVLNSGSDSSLRGVSPPNKISQAPVIQTQVYGKSYCSLDDASSLSQPLPVGYLSSQTFPHPRGKMSNSSVGGSKFNHPQVPYNQNPPVRGNVMSRNQRQYHSHRSGLGRRQRGSAEDKNGVTRPQPVNRAPRGGLKFQYSLDSFENPLEEISKMSLTHTLPYNYHKALSQDDHITGHPRGLGGGRGILRPQLHSTDSTVQETHATRKQVYGTGNQTAQRNHLLTGRHHLTAHHPSQLPISNPHTHTSHPSQMHTHNGHPSQTRAHNTHPSQTHTHTSHPSQIHTHTSHPSQIHTHTSHPSQTHSKRMTAV